MKEVKYCPYCGTRLSTRGIFSRYFRRIDYVKRCTKCQVEFPRGFGELIYRVRF